MRDSTQASQPRDACHAAVFLDASRLVAAQDFRSALNCGHALG